MPYAGDHGFSIEGQLPVITPKPVEAPTYVVVWRRGGTSFCEWIRVLERYTDRDDARAKAREIERMGYRAIVHPWNQIVAIGMPIGWTHDCVEWERDHVTIIRDPSGVMVHTYWGQGREGEPGSVEEAKRDW